MPDIIGIRFKSCGKIYDFEVNGANVEFKRGDLVIVESDLGLSIGSVVMERHVVESPAKDIKKVIRKVTEEDLKQKQDNENFEKEARGYCMERIMARGLPMKLVFTETTLDKKRLVFYFTADGRIDFRELVKDLAAKFKTRIEMRQIGVRDEAKIVGGFGICGRELCCKRFLTSFEPISIKMAKRQDLVLNMSKLSGVCGRLMCCLGYEYPDEVSDENDSSPDMGEIDKGEDKSVVEENKYQQEKVVEESPKLNIESRQHEDSSPESEKDTDVPKNPPAPTGEAAGNKPDHGQRRRKKWRWRKFRKE